MKAYLDLIFPLQLDTLWGRWVLLSLLVVVGGIVYLFLNYFFDSAADTEEEILWDDIVEQVLKPKTHTKEQVEMIDDVPQDIDFIAPEEKPSFLDSIKKLFSKKEKPSLWIESMSEDEWEDMSEEYMMSDDSSVVLPIVSEDEFEEIAEEDAKANKVEETNTKEDILMTEEKAQEIDNITRSTIHREEFDSELNYLKKKNRLEDYEKKLIEWLAKDPHHPWLIEYLAYHYIEQEQFKKSLPLLKRLLDQNAEHHKALRQMADIYLTLWDIQTAEVLNHRALELSPKNPKYALTLVEIYYNSKRKDEAIELMERIVKRRPENLGYWETLAKLYEEVKDYELAIECYQSMLTIDPKNAFIKRKLLEARTKMEK